VADGSTLVEDHKGAGGFPLRDATNAVDRAGEIR